MRLRNILYLIKEHKYKVLILAIIGAYFILSLLVLNSNPLLSLLSSIDNAYLLLVERFSNQILVWTGSNINIDNHIAFLNNYQLDGFFSETLYKKWGIILLFFVLITRSSALKKSLFAAVVITSNFILVSFDIALKAYLASLDQYYQTLPSLSLALGILIMVTILVLWYMINKISIRNSLSELNINTEIFEKKIPAIITVIYLYIFVGYFLIEAFEFQAWIDFLFGTSKKLLTLLGYKSTVEPFYLLGDNGNIYMTKSCLGIRTMLLFALVIYLTGNNIKIRWIYITFGILFLNIVNILRFVLLFIHIQKNGDYVLAMDIHDVYNYTIYVIVFILWVIWFEWFSDISPLKVKKLNT